uniref:Uncharacterized protein n=1 Tax=Lygus hesperus TaxID=30085 RepID=A0A0A9Z6V3_LYGHE
MHATQPLFIPCNSQLSLKALITYNKQSKKYKQRLSNNKKYKINKRLSKKTISESNNNNTDNKDAYNNYDESSSNNHIISNSDRCNLIHNNVFNICGDGHSLSKTNDSSTLYSVNPLLRHNSISVANDREMANAVIVSSMLYK